MQYIEFIKDIQTTLDELDLNRRYLEQYIRNPNMTMSGLDRLNQYKGDNPVDGHMMILKNTIKDLNIQVQLMRSDFNVLNVNSIPKFHFTYPMYIPTTKQTTSKETLNDQAS